MHPPSAECARAGSPATIEDLCERNGLVRNGAKDHDSRSNDYRKLRSSGKTAFLRMIAWIRFRCESTRSDLSRAWELTCWEWPAVSDRPWPVSARLRATWPSSGALGMGPVLLVDGNLAHPRQAVNFGLRGQNGLLIIWPGNFPPAMLAQRETRRIGRDAGWQPQARTTCRDRTRVGGKSDAKCARSTD